MDTPRILIVEDEVIIAEHIESNLRQFGYDVAARVNCGEKAVQKAAETKPDLVLMDIRLRGKMDGIEAAKQIKQTSSAPIIFLTAFADKSLLERAKTVQPSGYLIKPIQKQMLGASIEIALHMSSVDTQRRQAEKSLLDSEERWRSLTENGPDIVIELDRALTILFLNRPLPGLTRQSMIGSPITEMIPGWDQRNGFARALAEVLKTERPGVYEINWQSPDGGIFYYDARCVPRKNQGNHEVRGMIVSLVDRTIFRQVSRKLVERERWLEKTFEQVAVGIIHTDMAGKILRANQRYCEIMGYAEADLVGRNSLEFTDPTFLENHQTERQRVVEGENGSVTIEKINIRADGSPIWVALTLSLVCGENNSPEFMLGIVRDISQQKKAELDLRMSERRYRSLVENIPQRVFQKNLNNQYVTVNKRFAADFNLQPRDIEGKTVFDLFPAETATRHQAEDEMVITSGKSFESEELWELGDISRMVSSIKLPSENEAGEVEGVLGVYMDITERKEAEQIRKDLERDLQQTQKMQALGTLAGGVAHDFNNILHPIIGLSTLGSRNCEKEDANLRYFTDINKAARRAKELVSQILTFSRQSEPERKPMLLQPLIKEALKMIRSSLPSNIQIDTDINPDCGPVKADPTCIHQIVMNLATNAYHAMQLTGGTLSISLQPVNPDPDLSVETDYPTTPVVCLKVGDTGSGIAPEHVEKIFDPYFTTKEKDRGTGLGLSVVMGIVKAHHGNIAINTAPGQGTEFVLCFPITKPAAAPLEQGPVTVPVNFRGTEHILLVDDEPEIIFFQSEALKSLGYTITSNTNSAEALEQFRNDPDRFELIVTDMTMPGISGFDLSIEILKIKPETPIILCTGYSATVDEERATSIGIRKYLTKPIDQDDLAGAIRQLLDNESP